MPSSIPAGVGVHARGRRQKRRAPAPDRVQGPETLCAPCNIRSPSPAVYRCRCRCPHYRHQAPVSGCTALGKPPFRRTGKVRTLHRQPVCGLSILCLVCDRPGWTRNGAGSARRPHHFGHRLTAPSTVSLKVRPRNALMGHLVNAITVPFFPSIKLLAQDRRNSNRADRQDPARRDQIVCDPGGPRRH